MTDFEPQLSLLLILILLLTVSNFFVAFSPSEQRERVLGLIASSLRFSSTAVVPLIVVTFIFIVEVTAIDVAVDAAAAAVVLSVVIGDAAAIGGTVSVII